MAGRAELCCFIILMDGTDHGGLGYDHDDWMTEGDL